VRRRLHQARKITAFLRGFNPQKKKTESRERECRSIGSSPMQPAFYHNNVRLFHRAPESTTLRQLAMRQSAHKLADCESNGSCAVIASATAGCMVKIPSVTRRHAAPLANSERITRAPAPPRQARANSKSARCKFARCSRHWRFPARTQLEKPTTKN
jgi:hypothetical protein